MFWDRFKLTGAFGELVETSVTFPSPWFSWSSYLRMKWNLQLRRCLALPVTLTEKLKCLPLLRMFSPSQLIVLLKLNDLSLELKEMQYRQRDWHSPRQAREWTEAVQEGERVMRASIFLITNRKWEEIRWVRLEGWEARPTMSTWNENSHFGRRCDLWARPYVRSPIIEWEGENETFEAARWVRALVIEAWRTESDP